jgi:hypothetical protein
LVRRRNASISGMDKCQVNLAVIDLSHQSPCGNNPGNSQRGIALHLDYRPKAANVSRRGLLIQLISNT